MKIRPIRLKKVDCSQKKKKWERGMIEAWNRKRPFTVFRKFLKPKLLLAAEEVGTP